MARKKQNKKNPPLEIAGVRKGEKYFWYWVDFNRPTTEEERSLLYQFTVGVGPGSWDAQRDTWAYFSKVSHADADAAVDAMRIALSLAQKAEEALRSASAQQAAQIAPVLVTEQDSAATVAGVVEEMQGADAVDVVDTPADVAAAMFALLTAIPDGAVVAIVSGGPALAAHFDEQIVSANPQKALTVLTYDDMAEFDKDFLTSCDIALVHVPLNGWHAVVAMEAASRLNETGQLVAVVPANWMKAADASAMKLRNFLKEGREEYMHFSERLPMGALAGTGEERDAALLLISREVGVLF